MKINIVNKILLIMFLTIVISGIATISNAAIEVKPVTANNNYSPSSISTAFQLSYDLRNADSTLGVNNVDPHLMLNKDWSAVAYLACSTYGPKTKPEDKFVSINIGVESKYTTTGNMSGVMYSTTSNGWVVTSSVFKTEDVLNNSENYLKTIIEKKGTKYVEEIENPLTIENDKKMGYGLVEFTQSWGSISSLSKSSSLTCRGVDEGKYWITTTSNSSGRYFFRPAIWNIK